MPPKFWGLAKVQVIFFLENATSAHRSCNAPTNVSTHQKDDMFALKPTTIQPRFFGAEFKTISQDISIGSLLLEAELKHGRIAMLAFLGLVVPEFARIPGPFPNVGFLGSLKSKNISSL